MSLRCIRQALELQLPTQSSQVPRRALATAQIGPWPKEDGLLGLDEDSVSPISRPLFSPIPVVSFHPSGLDEAPSFLHEETWRSNR